MHRHLVAMPHLLQGPFRRLPCARLGCHRLGVLIPPCLQVALPPQGGRQVALELCYHLIPAPTQASPPLEGAASCAGSSGRRGQHTDIANWALDIKRSSRSMTETS